VLTVHELHSEASFRDLVSCARYHLQSNTHRFTTFDQSTMAQANNPGPQQVNDDTPARVRCLGGCGFWGDASTKNHCSVCFKKKFPDEAEALKNAKAAQSASSSPSNNDPSAASESKEDANSNSDHAVCPPVDDKPKRKVQKKKNRCWKCKKKMTLAGQFACKCGYTFCAKHRYADSHECDVDHKKKHKDKLAKQNQVVAFKKVEDI